MITIVEQSIETIPALFVAKQDKQDEPLPTMIYFHGFTSAKEHNLPIAYLLAAKNYRVVLPDSKYHGLRAGDISEAKRQLSFWDIVLNNVAEMKLIKRYLENEQLLLDGRIGVAGTSMGGITTAALLVAYDWVRVAAILMGSAKLTSFAQLLLKQFPDQSQLPSQKEINELMEILSSYDLSRQIDKLDERPLLLWHGDADRVVPFEHASSFYQRAKATYQSEQHIHFIKEPHQGHKVSRRAILQTVEWFTTYL